MAPIRVTSTVSSGSVTPSGRGSIAIESVRLPGRIVSGLAVVMKSLPGVALPENANETCTL